MEYQLEDLRIYKLAEDLADEICDVVSQWHPFAKGTVGRQLVRAADSIGANIAEGYGRHHLREEITFLYYARGSLKETTFWLRRALKRQLLSQDQYDHFAEMLDNLMPQLNSYIKSRYDNLESQHA